MRDLRELQERFFASVRAQALPAAAPADSALLATIATRPPLTAAARMEVYAGMYAARLIDALAESFPKVAARLGPEDFQTLGRAYLAESPSRHPSLRYAGEDFSAFLVRADHLPPYLGELARLEWVRLAVFDAADAPVLTLASLQEHPPETWHALELRLIPAFTTLESTWPVHEIWAADPDPAHAWSPARAVLRVWRQDFLVYQAPMDALEAAALAALAQGASFGNLCACVAAAGATADAAREAAALVLRWIGDGLLAAPG